MRDERTITGLTETRLVKTSGSAEETEVGESIAKLLRFQQQNREGFERAVEGLMPPAVPSVAETEQARRNAELRADYLANTPCYTSDQIAALAGSTAKNKAQRASRFKKENRVFSITHDGQRYFPAFQFDADINPKPVIAGVLESLDEYGLHGWQIALWFVTHSAFLGGQRPLDLLDRDPDLVLAAATREAPW